MHLTLVLFIALVPAITTLKCFVCNSNENKECANESNLSKFSQICAETVEPYCRKAVQTVEAKTSIVRSCGSKIGNKECYKTAGKNNANVCSCNTDLCNHATRFSAGQQWMTVVSSMIGLAATMLFLR